MNRVRPRLATSKYVFQLWLIVRKFLPRTKCQVFCSPNSKQKASIEKIYVINLDRAIDRWTKIKHELRNIHGTEGVELLSLTERCTAVDGKNISCETLKTAEVDPSYTLADQLYVEPQPLALPTQFQLSTPIQMSPTEIAVARSHIAIWKQVALGDHEYTLILEDDVLFHFSFAQNLDQVWIELEEQNHVKGKFDILYLSYQEVLNGAQKTFLSSNIFSPVRGLWYLSGYVLSREGANKLLQLLPCRGPIDLWINHQFNVLDVRAIKRPIIFQRSDTQSTNSYSILPALTTIGAITSEGASLFNINPTERPVFVFGPGASGHTSLAMALSMLGYRCCSDLETIPVSEFKRLLQGSDDRIFDAYVNIGSLDSKIKELRIRYPRAKHILIAPEDNLEYFAFRNIINDLQGADVILLTSENLNTWDTICEHLRCAPPSCPYPELNDRGQRSILEDTAEAEPFPNFKKARLDKSKWVAEPHSKWFGINAISTEENMTNTGTRVKQSDFLNILDTSRWYLGSDTFTDNLALFRPPNIEFSAEYGAVLSVRKQKLGVRNYSGASICSRDQYLFGRFEARIQASNVPGVVTGFFLHRNSPRQEIDIEIAGNNPNQLIVNVFYNPGGEGANFDYGYRGTPSYINLDFDASKESHNYAIEWNPNEIRWLVDEQLVHRRMIWNPTPIPHLPMLLHVNLWLSRSTELAGRINDRRLPATATIRSLSLAANTITPSFAFDNLRTQDTHSVLTMNS